MTPVPLSTPCLRAPLSPRPSPVCAASRLSASGEANGRPDWPAGIPGRLHTGLCWPGPRLGQTSEPCSRDSVESGRFCGPSGQPVRHRLATGRICSPQASGKRGRRYSRGEPLSDDPGCLRRQPCYCPLTDCGKRLARTDSLVRHMRIHSGERPWACPHAGCDRRFVDKGSLNVHLRRHTGERPFVCPLADCGKRFVDGSSLVAHRRIHTGEKPWSCPFPDCGKRFAHSSTLADHRRIHTGIRPYLCPEPGCTKRFVQTGHLVTHLRAHRRIPRFPGGSAGGQPGAGGKRQTGWLCRHTGELSWSCCRRFPVKASGAVPLRRVRPVPVLPRAHTAGSFHGRVRGADRLSPCRRPQQGPREAAIRLSVIRRIGAQGLVHPVPLLPGAFPG